VIAFVAAAPSIDRTHVVDALAPGETRICLSVSDGEELTEFYEPGPPRASRQVPGGSASPARCRRARRPTRRHG
jgi:hypothetical protein